MKLTLLSRQDCGLCEDVASLLRQLGLDFEAVDIDREPDLTERYNEAIPVLLLDGAELCRAPISRDGLRSAFRGVNLRSG